MHEQSLPTVKTSNPEAMPAYAIVLLVEGRDFDHAGDYSGILNAIKHALDIRGHNESQVLLTGYDAASSESSEVQRNSTWAMPISEVEPLVGRRFANHPIMYSRVKRPRPGSRPTIAAYDSLLLRRKRIHEPDEYVPLPGYHLEDAKLAEFRLRRLTDAE